MKKRVNKPLAVLLVLFLLAGCDRMPDITSRAIVSAVGIKQGSSDVTVTVEYLEKVGAEEKQRYGTSQGRGITFADAVNAIERDIGHSLYLDSCRILLVGGTTRRDTLLEILSAVDADRRIRPLTMVAISKGDPGEMILNKHDEETSVGKKLQELLGGKKIDRYSMKDCINLLRTPGRGILMPLVDQDEEYVIAGYTPLNGTELFWNEKVASLIPMLGHDSAPVTVVGKDGTNYDLLLEKNSLWVQCSWKNGQPFFRLKVRVEGNLISATSSGLIGTEVTRLGAEALEMRTWNDYQYVLENIFQKGGVDVFSLGKRFSFKYPGEWSNLSNDWESIIKNLECEIVVTAKVQDQREIIT